MMRDEQGILSINTSESIDEGNGSLFRENNSFNLVRSPRTRKNSIKTKEDASTDFGQAEISSVNPSIDGAKFQSFVKSILQFKLGTNSENSSNVMNVKKPFWSSGYDELQGKRNKPPKKEAKHHGYECDVCFKYPIIGERFHCQQCESYDQCQGCHEKSVHIHHNFRVYDRAKNEEIKEALRKSTMLRILANPSIRKSSIR